MADYPPTLHTERLELRPFTLADAPRVRALAGEREVASTTLNIPHPYEEGMAEAWIRSHDPAWMRRERVTYAITTEADGLVGAISLGLVLVHRRAELGYWIGVPYWNRGYATEAARAVIGFGFDTLGLERIHATHLTRNPASGRVMQKVGMQFEGYLRQHVIKWDRPEGVNIYAILRSDGADATGQPASESAIHLSNRDGERT